MNGKWKTYPLLQELAYKVKPVKCTMPYTQEVLSTQVCK